MKNKNIKKIIIATLVVLLFTGAVAGALEITNKINLVGDNPKSKTPNLEPKINMSGPTEADKQQVEDNKERIVEQDKSISQQDSPNGTTAPTITYADQYKDQIEIGAIVPVFEEGGTCTATMSKGSSSVKKSVQAVLNTRSVDCPVMRIPRSELPTPGTWSVTVVYTSPAYQGASAPRNIEIE